MSVDRRLYSSERTQPAGSSGLGIEGIAGVISGADDWTEGVSGKGEGSTIGCCVARVIGAAISRGADFAISRPA